jgi:ribosomal protein S18 acetylase RimI-like enzyme
MIIKSASIDDIVTIQKLAAVIWPVTYKEILSADQLDYMLQKFYSIEVLQDQMLTKGHQFFVLINNNKDNIGYAAVTNENTGTFKLQKLYLLPNQQGKNFGRILLSEIISFCRKKAAKSMILNVNRYNKARFFYEKFGFKIIDEVDISIGNNYFMNDYVMELNL